MAINQNITFEALRGLMQRANTQERLVIADEWLRANKRVSIPEYHICRDIWWKMYKRFGMYRIIIRAGSVKHVYASNLSFGEAYRVCKESHWKHNHNNGLMWDMEIDEQI